MQSKPVTETNPLIAEQPAANKKLTGYLFAGLCCVFCAWALSLPLFPTQDGPMHKYYVHAIASLLSGSHTYDAYALRRPFPPYATHYAVLLGLTRVVSFDLAEKLLICLIFICTAYGFRYCARAMGPSGDLVSLCVIPLLLHWSLVMGFLNYSLAVGLFFLAAGLWRRASDGQLRLWFAFLAISLSLAITHPIPLLLLIIFGALNLMTDVVQARCFTLRDYGWRLAGLAITCLSFLYPLLSVDRSRSAANLRGTTLHSDAVLSSVALFGLSPFDTRSRNLLINGYRVGLYLLLFGCLVLGAKGFLGRWRTRQLGSGDTLLIGSVVVLLAIPILPASMNGSDYFAQRLMIFPWLGAMAAASGYAYPRRLAHVVPLFAVALCVLTLVPAEIFFRPVARQLFALENQRVPAHVEGLAILDPGMLKAVRRQHQLGFNPYVWSGALPFLHADDVMLNSPFMDQKITPLMPTPGGDLLIDQMSSPAQAEQLINGNVDLPALPPGMRSTLLASTRTIVLVATPEAEKRGLAPLVGEQQATQYACTSYVWYLVCSR